MVRNSKPLGFSVFVLLAASLQAAPGFPADDPRFLSNVDTGFSNCRGFISNKAATLAEMLRDVGDTPVELLPWCQTMYGMDIGRDLGSTVSPAYTAPCRFEGRLLWVEFHLDDDREDTKKAARIEVRNALTDQ